jgi:hypothetical protein
MTVLLALNIESALSPTESGLVRSMAQISVSQIMLLLAQAKQMPVLQRALPIFEEILAKTNLLLVPSNTIGQVRPQSQPQETGMANQEVSTPAQVESQVLLLEDNQAFDLDFLGIDFLDEWEVGQMDFTG